MESVTVFVSCLSSLFGFSLTLFFSWTSPWTCLRLFPATVWTSSGPFAGPTPPCSSSTSTTTTSTSTVSSLVAAGGALWLQNAASVRALRPPSIDAKRISNPAWRANAHPLNSTVKSTGPWGRTDGLDGMRQDVRTKRGKTAEVGGGRTRTAEESGAARVADARWMGPWSQPWKQIVARQRW